MSWKSGSELASDIWKSFYEHIDLTRHSDEEIACFAIDLIDLFESYDCDTVRHECPEIFKAALDNDIFCAEYVKELEGNLDLFIEASERYEIELDYLVNIYKEIQSNIKNERHLDN